MDVVVLAAVAADECESVCGDDKRDDDANEILYAEAVGAADVVAVGAVDEQQL